MRTGDGSIAFSYIAGMILIALGAFVDPLLTVLGTLICVSGWICKVVESHRRKYQAMELEQSEKLGMELEQKTA